MSTALRDLLWSTDPLYVHYTGLTSAETGGTVRPVQYDDDAPAPTSIYAAATSLSALTQPQETSMTYEYDDHAWSTAGDPIVGAPQNIRPAHERGSIFLRLARDTGELERHLRRQQRVDWLRVAVYSGALIGGTVFWYAVFLLAKGWFS